MASSSVYSGKACSCAPGVPNHVTDAPGRQHQVVERQIRLPVDVEHARRPVHAADPTALEADVGLAVEEPAHDVGHVGGAEPGRGHLVQERLEGVEVVLVDQGHLDRRALQAPGDLEPTEPGAHHHDLGDHGHVGSLPAFVKTLTRRC